MMQIAGAIRTFSTTRRLLDISFPGIARKRTDERTGQTCPARNLSLGKALDADMLDKKSGVRNTSWPQALASFKG